jgi:hypothetical protein
MPSDDATRAEQQRLRRNRNALTKAANDATSFGCPSACWPLNLENLTIKPSGTTPRNYYWDPWSAKYRRKQTHAVYEPRVQRSDARAAARDGRQHGGLNRARCNDDILKPGFDLGSVKPHDGGKLGDATCAYCGALLYPSESVAIPTRGGLKRGKHCCCGGLWHSLTCPDVRFKDLPVPFAPHTTT